MSATQYIGARYVPLFAEPLDWDSTKEYEALTIVYYAGNSYTSRQAVPKGIDITNEKYWALTGNYNAQIEAYRKETAMLQKDVDANTKNIAALIDGAAKTTKQIQTLADKNMLWVGDEYCDASLPYCQFLKDCSFYSKIVNVSKSGCGFTTSTSFRTLALNAGGAYDTVVIFGGKNDASKLTNTPSAVSNDIYYAVQNCIDGINNAYSTPNIIIIGANFTCPEIDFKPNIVGNWNCTLQSAVAKYANVTFVPFDCYTMQPTFNNYYSQTVYAPSNVLTKYYYLTSYFDAVVNKLPAPGFESTLEYTFNESKTSTKKLAVTFTSNGIGSSAPFTAAAAISNGSTVFDVATLNPRTSYTLNFLVFSRTTYTVKGMMLLTSTANYNQCAWQLNTSISAGEAYTLHLMSANA